jgi:hypothetical protein
LFAVARKISELQLLAPTLASLGIPFQAAVALNFDPLTPALRQLLRCTTGTGSTPCPAPFDAALRDFEQLTAQVEAFLAVTANAAEQNIDRALNYAVSSKGDGGSCSE